MHIHYLEIVTPEPDAACELYAVTHNVSFSDPDPSLGGARTAGMADGGLMGVRAPMHEGEQPVTRPYFLVDDIAAAVASAAQAGAQVLVPPMEIPGHGHCAIYLHGNVERGLWQVCG